MKHGKIRPRKDKPYDYHEKQTRPRKPSKDDTVIRIIQALDLFIAHSAGADLGPVAQILSHAKEEVVFWAATMDMEETREERFINRLLYSNHFFAASDFISQLVSLQANGALEELLKYCSQPNHHTSLVQALRRST